jgi:hypothetical protein
MIFLTVRRRGRGVVCYRRLAAVRTLRWCRARELQASREVVQFLYRSGAFAARFQAPQLRNDLGMPA